MYNQKVPISVEFFGINEYGVGTLAFQAKGQTQHRIILYNLM